MKSRVHFHTDELQKKHKIAEYLISAIDNFTEIIKEDGNEIDSGLVNIDIDIPIKK